MSARDDLVGLVSEVFTANDAHPRYPEQIADAILAAGWVPPERLADVVAERDKAREECGYEKRMRTSAQEASDRYIRLKMDRDKTLQRVHDLLDAAPLISEHVGKGGLVDRKPMVPAADLRTALGGQEGTSSC